MYEFTLVCAVALEGHDSLRVADSFNNMANIYETQGKYEEAFKLHTKSLEIRTRLYGGDSHPLLTDSFKGLRAGDA